MKLNYKKILAYAHNAGMAAGSAKVATPMTLVDSDLFVNPIGKTYYVPEGPCGFAYVITNEHGNGKFVKYLKSSSNGYRGAGEKYYYGGYYVTNPNEFGQSVEKKEAYADAYAKVLNDYGIKAYSFSRLD